MKILVKPSLLVMALIMIFSMNATAQTTVHHFGDHPFCAEKITSAEGLRQMIMNRNEDLAEGFVKAGEQELFAQLMIQLDDLEISRTSVAPDSTFKWMMFAHNNKIYVVDDVTYAGKKAADAWAFDVVMDRTNYHMVVPAECGNLSLAGMTAIPNKAPECDLRISPSEVKAGGTITADASGSVDPDGSIGMAKFMLTGPNGISETKTVETAPFAATFTLPDEGDYEVAVQVADNEGMMSASECKASITALAPDIPVVANVRPECDVTVSPMKVFDGEMIIVDADASSDPDGTVKSVKFDLVDTEGNVVASETVSSAPFKTSLMVPHAGDFQVKTTVMDDDGDSSSCGKMGIRGVKRFGFLGDIGVARQFDPAWYVMARIGAEYRFSETVSIIGMVGGFPKVADDEGETAITADLMLTFNSRGAFWAGIGAGAWITDGDDDVEHEDSQIDAIFNMGFRLWGDATGPSTSVFGEVRSGFDEFDSLIEYGRFIIGLRFFF